MMAIPLPGRSAVRFRLKQDTVSREVRVETNGRENAVVAIPVDRTALQ